MPHRYSEYARLIKTERIHFLPTCLILEILSSVYGYTVCVPVTRRALPRERSRVIKMLGLFHNDLACTVEAYESGRVRFFNGDWKMNRGKAQRVFALLMDKLNTLGGCFGGLHQERLKRLAARVERAWLELCALLDEKCGLCDSGGSGGTTRYFQKGSLVAWRKTMAKIITEFREESGYGDDGYLLLICCAKVKKRLLKQIEQIQAKRGAGDTFDSDCILCLSNRRSDIACPFCTRFNDGILRIPKAAGQGAFAPFQLHPAYRAAFPQEDYEPLARANSF